MKGVKHGGAHRVNSTPTGFRDSHVQDGANVDFVAWEHGHRFMKFIATSNSSHYQDDPCHPTVEIHGLLCEDGSIVLTDTIVKNPKPEREDDDE